MAGSRAKQIRPPFSPIPNATKNRKAQQPERMLWQADSRRARTVWLKVSHARSDCGRICECHRRPGALDEQRGCKALPLGEMRRRSGKGRRNRAVRARLVDGLAADL